MGSRQVTSWQDKNITVAGLGVSGISAARALAGLGAVVTVVDNGDGDAHRARAAELQAQGITVRLGRLADGGQAGEVLPEGTELVVTSPGWKPDSPLFQAAAAVGVDVVGDVEIAWLLREIGQELRAARSGGTGAAEPRKAPAAWLAVTGTNGKTTTTQMLASILKAAGLRTAAVGNIGTPIIDVVLGEQEYDVLAVELSSYQLHWAPSLRVHSAAVLNLAPDHLDWHGSMEAYAADKGRIYEGNTIACVYNVADPATENLVMEADVEEGCRAIGFTLGAPGPSMLGVVDGILVDRAFVENRQKNAQSSPRSRTSTRRPRTTSPTRSPPRPWPVPSAWSRAPFATGCATSARTPTASRTWTRSTRSPTSTTPRPPTRTRPRPRSRPSSRSSGSPAASPRARPSTSSCGTPRSGCAAPC